MLDINLLPEDIKKKREGSAKSKSQDFGVEFTKGQKLKKYQDNKIGFLDKVSNWFRPKKSRSNNKPKVNLVEKKLSSKQDLLPKKLDNKKNYSNINSNDFNFDSNSKKEVSQVKSIHIPKKEPKIFKKKLVVPEKKDISPVFNKKLVKKGKIEKKSIKIKKKGSFFSRFFRSTKKNIPKNKSLKSKLDVNLLPSGINLPRKENLYSIFISAFILSLMVIIISYFAIDIYKIKINREYISIKTEIDSKIDNLKEYDRLIEEMTDWRDKVSHIRDLFKDHIYWTKFFAILEKHTLKDVRFSNFASSLDGNLTLSGVAPDYYTVSKQWKHLKNSPDFVDNVLIDGASLSMKELEAFINFSITLDLVDDIFINFQEEENEKQ
ncbi:hypothetical protein K8R66_01365 [bacterium]|nr:hypothetical protein [bacterium]